MKSIRNCIFLLIALVVGSLSSLVHAQDVSIGIVKIISSGEHGEETGTGFIVGRFGAKVFIATALHVIAEADPESIRVRLNTSTGEDYKAQLHYEINEELDLAVLIIQVPLGQTLGLHKYKRADTDKLKVGDRVTCFGYPLSAEILSQNDFNKIQDLRFGTKKFKISSIEIQPGFSGGPVTEGKKNRLVGMMTTVQSGAAVAVHIDEILAYLDRWLIPTNLIKNEPIKNISFILGGAAGVLMGAGMVFNDMGAENYQIYAENKDESAYTDPESLLFDKVEGKERDVIYDQAKNQYMIRNVSYGLAGASLLAGIWLSLKKDPQKEKQMQNGIQFNNGNAFNYGLTLAPEGLQLALNLRF